MEYETGAAATARVVALLSQQQWRRQRAGRLFECKTCGRRFPTFQALGGHRASHRRPGPYDAPGTQKMVEAACVAGPRVHGCPVCGLEFAVGQALGGHMRRHRAAGGAQGSMAVTPPEACSSADHGGDCVGGICLELNLMSSASCAKCQTRFGATAQNVYRNCR